jgi:hypothetical protein
LQITQNIKLTQIARESKIFLAYNIIDNMSAVAAVRRVEPAVSWNQLVAWPQEV